MVPWRLKERMKTVSVALVACLNIRVDPPDVVKPSPCARMECWTDPYSTTPAKALEQIGKNLEVKIRPIYNMRDTSGILNAMRESRQTHVQKRWGGGAAGEHTDPVL